MHTYEFVQERCNSIANALELRLSCTKPSIYSMICYFQIGGKRLQDRYLLILYLYELMVHCIFVADFIENKIIETHTRESYGSYKAWHLVATVGTTILVPSHCVLLQCSKWVFSDVMLILHLTQWGWDKMAAILQTTNSNTFCWIKMFEFQLKFHWSLFLRVQLTISQHWLR